MGDGILAEEGEVCRPQPRLHRHVGMEASHKTGDHGSHKAAVEVP